MKTGYFGKLPSYGDFVQRNVAPSIIEYWDNWLTQSIDTSQGVLGDKWKEVYFTSPIWRFHIQSGIISPEPLSGLMMPSIDAAGRCYPFIVICQFEQALNLFTLASEMDNFHKNCEDIIIELLQHSRPDLDEIATSLQSNYSKTGLHLFPTLTPKEHIQGAEIFHSFNQSIRAFSEANEELLAFLFEQQSTPVTIWHTTQSANTDKQFRYYEGMPPASAFPSLLQGEIIV